jgi:hypothetical protein
MNELQLKPGHFHVMLWDLETCFFMASAGKRKHALFLSGGGRSQGAPLASFDFLLGRGGTSIWSLPNYRGGAGVVSLSLGWWKPWLFLAFSDTTPVEEGVLLLTAGPGWKSKLALCSLLSLLGEKGDDHQTIGIKVPFHAWPSLTWLEQGGGIPLTYWLGWDSYYP